MTDWITQLDDLMANGESAVLLTVAGVRGSAPREIGAKMIVTTTQTIGTIGGGQLEYQCTQIASGQLRDAVLSHENTVRRFALGSGCGQCCGGVVDVLFEQVPATGSDWLTRLSQLHRERKPVVIATSTKTGGEKFLITEDGCDESCPAGVNAAAQAMLSAQGTAGSCSEFLLEPVAPVNFQIAIFGAGHVGAATVDALSRLDCSIRWIDSRRNVFPGTLPTNVTAIESADPAREVAAMPAGSYFLVMTHSHPLDFDICDQALRRGDSAYCGLIGSVSKRRRFERLMLSQGMPEKILNKLVCPIGVPGIEGKKPVEIALAVAAEILRTRDAIAAAEVRPVPLKVHA
jgi:xanthine dehydrogenase accessory factor